MTDLCIPEPGTCSNYHAGHWCGLKPGHDDRHVCSCKNPNDMLESLFGITTWPRDWPSELAQLAYRERNTVPYLDAPDIPPDAAIEAATGPGTSWRRTGEAIARYIGKVE